MDDIRDYICEFCGKRLPQVKELRKEYLCTCGAIYVGYDYENSTEELKTYILKKFNVDLIDVNPDTQITKSPYRIFSQYDFVTNGSTDKKVCVYWIK